MQTNYHQIHTPLKTMGPKGAWLVAELHAKNRTIFTHADVESITGLRLKSARNLIARLVDHGIATRLKPGLFVLVPFEMGHEREYMGNPYVVARELAGGEDYYISHASAMDLHDMVTQPQLVIFTSTTRFIRPQVLLGVEFRFVRCKPQGLFGIEDHWVDKTQKIRVSDPERTIIDGLKQPEHCGGVSEVAKGLWMRRSEMNPELLVDYALRMNVGVLIRRLGFLMESCGIDAPDQIDRLRQRLSDGYQLLDPMLETEGKYLARWRLRLNIEPEELEAARSV